MGMTTSIALHANLGLRLVDIIFGVNAACRGKAAKENEECKEDQCNGGDTAKDRLPVAKVSPLAAGLARIALDGLIAKLVVDHTGQRNAIAKELEGRHLSPPNHHGGNNEQDILENTAKSEHKG